MEGTSPAAVNNPLTHAHTLFPSYVPHSFNPPCYSIQSEKVLIHLPTFRGPHYRSSPVFASHLSHRPPCSLLSLRLLAQLSFSATSSLLSTILTDTLAHCHFPRILALNRPFCTPLYCRFSSLNSVCCIPRLSHPLPTA